MNRIHDALTRALARNRLVFWYDPTGDWSEAFDAFEAPDTTRLRLERNEFATKVRIARDPDARFLVYSPAARPPDAENWLLDLLLQGHEFRADRTSLALDDAGLPHAYRHLAEEHGAFFRSGKRVQALRELVSSDDEPEQIRLKMMAVLAGLVSPDLDTLLLRFLARGAGELGLDPIEETFGSAALVAPFWRLIERAFGYTSPTPSLRDFAVLLFRAANPLDKQATLHPHARVFLQRWQDSQSQQESFRAWSRTLEEDLQVAAALEDLADQSALGEWDTFEVFERFTLHRLCQAFEVGVAAELLRETIHARRDSFWYPDHRDGYAALEHAVELRESIAAAELMVESVDAGVSRYTGSWWRIDTAYRRCILHLRRYNQVNVMERIREWVEKAYINNFLLPLADHWSDRVRDLERWASDTLPAQNTFFEMYVQPFRNRGQKVFVIISDALRYEAAAEFAERISAANRWTAELEANFGMLPSYTQLGMAALLPGARWAVDAGSGSVTVDGQSASGTANRAEILCLACGGSAVALTAEAFLELNTKTEGRALAREHDVIYIFHNLIDKVGDDARTEAKTFDAVEEAFDELDAILRKVANVNGNNMILTADHGFLFQQDPVADGDMMPIPKAAEWTYTTRRFALGREIEPKSGVKLFPADALGLEGDWTAAFPLNLGRFPLKGSGKRYVHGGLTLQEIVIPVVKIHKARSDDTGRVEVEPLRVPTKITTGQLSIALFQQEPAVDKVLPRTLRVGIYAQDGTLLSEVKTVTFDSRELEPRQRETTVLLALSFEADAYNNQDVELRLEELVPGTSQLVTYKAHRLKLQKPFTSDFDEF
jgi:uncharacterized protein (TIGR02687 family)